MKQPEQHTADLLRVLFRLKLLGYDDIDRMIDELQLRLAEREGWMRGRLAD